MGDCKNLVVKIISATNANTIIKKYHYSGKVVVNSQLHFGVFQNNVCLGAMQFGPSMRKDLIQPIVKNTAWNGFIELNRMAFSSLLPKNSESRCLAYALRYIKKNYPHIEWVITFADGTQCGDGTIYRASGFSLIGVKANTQLRINPETGKTIQSMTAFHLGKVKAFKTWEKKEGFQLKYIYFLNKEARNRLTVPILPFSAIDKMGAGMYLGKKKTSGGSVTVAQPAIQQERGGSIPTSSQNEETNAEST
jgi:hypothetical protein